MRAHYVTQSLTFLHHTWCWRVMLCKYFWALWLLVIFSSFSCLFCCFFGSLLFFEYLKLSNLFLFCFLGLSYLFSFFSFLPFLNFSGPGLLLRFLKFNLKFLLFFKFYLFLTFWWRTSDGLLSIMKTLLRHSDLFCEGRWSLIIRLWILLYFWFRGDGLLNFGFLWSIGSLTWFLPIVVGPFISRCLLQLSFHFFLLNSLYVLFRATTSHFKFEIIILFRYNIYWTQGVV